MRNAIGFVCFLLFVLGCVSSPVSVEDSKTAPVEVEKPVSTQKTLKNVVVTEKVPFLNKETFSFSDGTVDQYVIYEYDQASTLLITKMTYNASTNTLQDKTEREYKDGLIISETSFDEKGGVKINHQYQNNGEGRITVDTMFDPNDKIVSVQKIAYNSAGNRSEWKSFGAGDVLRAISSYNYEKDLLVMVEMKDGVGLLMGTTKYSYDSNGNLVKRSYFDKKGALEKYDELVWKDNVLVEEKIYGMKNSLLVWMIYDQYKDGVAHRKTIKDGQGTVVDIRTYEYIILEVKKTVQVLE